MERKVYHQEYMRYYDEGTAVRKQIIEPEYERPYEVPYESPEQEIYIPPYAKVRKREAQKGLRIAMSPVFASFLGMAVVATLAACCLLLSMQAKVTNQSDTITTLQAQIENLEEENDAYETRINDSIDLEAIRDIAINELGMVYPSEGQVVYYDMVESDYVRQYQDVPAVK
jgi:cell division protein FtsL